ncbi:hypothetical protein C7H79_03420 [Nitrosomonas supralitoralis]|uniref:Uncharacterized protein n=2 Tax=Nitrosomonas supralitoralis TaxID=2116706 RepID=A0A2P7NY98_9PROT|nr:hypothetical protein C7H79_03420 [Nitrosomonas supralitoralis]
MIERSAEIMTKTGMSYNRISLSTSRISFLFAAMFHNTRLASNIQIKKSLIWHGRAGNDDKETSDKNHVVKSRGYF